MNKTNSNILVIKDQLKQLAYGGNWLDENFNKKLSSIQDTEAFRQPLANVHSIAEIVWHCIYWHKVNMERMLGNTSFRDQTISALNFLPISDLKEMGWEKLKEQLTTSFEELLSLLHDKDDSFLDKEYEDGKSFHYLLLGTIDHDSYHLGQIGLVNKIIHSKD